MYWVPTGTCLLLRDSCSMQRVQNGLKMCKCRHRSPGHYVMLSLPTPCPLSHFYCVPSVFRVTGMGWHCPSSPWHCHYPGWEAFSQRAAFWSCDSGPCCQRGLKHFPPGLPARDPHLEGGVVSGIQTLELDRIPPGHSLLWAPAANLGQPVSLAWLWLEEFCPWTLTG